MGPSEVWELLLHDIFRWNLAYRRTDRLCVRECLLATAGEQPFPDYCTQTQEANLTSVRARRRRMLLHLWDVGGTCHWQPDVT